MKKTISLGIMALIAIATVTSIALFNNKEDALADFKAKKHTRESTINDTVTTIAYTTDKECTINYETEAWKCKQCFNYTIQNSTYDRCIYLSEDGNAADDEAAVKATVRRDIEERIPKEQVKYTARNNTGQTIELEKKSAVVVKI